MANLRNIKEKLNLGDLAIVPTILSDIDSRSEVVTTYENGQSPFFVAPMDTVLDGKNYKTFMDAGLNVCLPRGIYLEENTPNVFESYSLDEFIEKFITQREPPKHWYIHIDIANGHMSKLFNACIEAKEAYGDDLVLMIGNIANPETYASFAEIGVDYCKFGIGGGCLDGETRILMAEGIYKNIKDIEIGEYVINRNGEPVKVINKIFSGIKKVKSVKTNSFYKEMLITPDHQVLINDLSNLSKASITALGYKKSFKDERVSWKPIEEYVRGTLLTPNKITFNIPDNITINLQEFESTKSLFDNKIINDSYELGYIFGLFLGDGSSRTSSNFNKKKNYFSKVGNAHWYFNKTEIHIAEKLKECLINVFNITPSIQFKKSIIQVNANKKALASLFNEFYIDKTKILPKKYLSKNKEYLKGIFDGLIDSDGNIDGERFNLTNTSTHIIELFNIINHILYGYFPNGSINSPSVGNLQNCNKNNLKQSYSARTLKNPNVRINGNYYIVKILNIENQLEPIETWDIEVECETHSFIANNVIVHNSACTTTTHTGIHYPMASLLMEARAIKEKAGYFTNIIADGGISSTADINIALACGADFVMMGSIFNKTNEACGQAYLSNRIPIPNKSINFFKGLGFKVYRKYRGMSTVEVQKSWKKRLLRPSEGIHKRNEVLFSLEELISNLNHRLATAMSYTGDMYLETFVSGETELVKKTTDTNNRVNK
jgi:intein/homing endonuclease